MAHSVDFQRNGASHVKPARNGHDKGHGALDKEKVTARRTPQRDNRDKKTRGAKSRSAVAAAQTADMPSVPPRGPHAAAHPPRGVPVERCFTSPDVDPLDAVVYERRSSTISNPDGSIVFKMEGAEVPAAFSQLATDIVISKYFRKAGLHGEKDLGETSVRQVVHRIAHTIRRAGDDFGGYFATQADADT